MADVMVTSYWCYMCQQTVNPIMELELKCPFCESGFVEEMTGREALETEELVSVGSERVVSPWASVLLGMVSNTSRHPQSQRSVRVEDDDEIDLERALESILWRRRSETDEDGWRMRMEEGDDESYTDHELDSILRRRRQSSAILQLLHSLREDFRSESDEPEREREMERENENLVLINSFNGAVILGESFDADQSPTHESDNTATIGASIGDYFVGPGLELLLQHLAENDPNRHGTPPAQKEAVDALPKVKVDENINCPVCLEGIAVGTEAREMPCKHKFHGGCILPWLELHSSCPVCRFQLPADESKASAGSASENRDGGVGGDGGIRERRNRSRASASWPFSGMF